MTLGKRSDYGDAKYAGLEVPFPANVEAAVQDALLCGFDFIVTPLTRPDHRPPPPQPSKQGQLPQPFNRDDVLYLGSSQWVRQVVGSVSSWIDPDSTDEALKRDSISALKSQLCWAAHLGLQAVLLPQPPRRQSCAHYAQVINQVLEDVTHMALWLTVPLTGAADSQQGSSARSSISGSNGGGVGIPQQDAAMVTEPSNGVPDSRPAESDTQPQEGCPFGGVSVDGWETWHAMRSLCGHDQLLGCVLLMGQQLPSAALLARWDAEPVKAVLVPTSVFTINKRGYPVLPKPHQEFISHILSLQVQVVLIGECLHPPNPPPPPLPENPTPAELAAATAQGSSTTPAGAHVVIDPSTGMNFTVTNPGETHPMRQYWEYLAYLFRKLPIIPEDVAVENEYRDYLQAPLQPLQDNLESNTYEVFEKDTIKYTQYEEAVFCALRDRAGLPPGRQPSQQQPVILMVVGAGRGPLVAASMRASARSGVPLKIYAVEKNPNAVVHIQQMLRREGWEDKVEIVSADMRYWQAPQPADILVSELLGSFGDNELSPECLDGAQRFLAPGGISIPSRYTSFMAPVATHKLWTDARAYKDAEHFETPYVVKLFRHYLLAPTQEVFTFVHPNNEDPIDNARYKRCTFSRPAASGSAIMHGFAGYFECELYPGVMLSTHPPTHTPNMGSWFPIYFPLKDPVYVPAGAHIEAHMWRCCASHKVWYEWGVTSPVATRIHNVCGRSSFVGL